MSILSGFVDYLKTKAVAMNEEGIPLPLIRDQHMNGGSLPGTMFFISFNVALLTLIGKITKYLGDVDYSNVMWLMGITGGFWFMEAMGKKFSISKDKIELERNDGGDHDGSPS